MTKVDKYRALWYGGHNYIQPNSTDTKEIFPNLGVMEYELIRRRYDGKAETMYEDLGYDRTNTPAVDETSEFQIYNKDNDLIGRMFFGPRNGVRIEWL